VVAEAGLVGVMMVVVKMDTLLEVGVEETAVAYRLVDESGKVEIAETRRVVVAIVVRMVVVIVVTAEGEEVVT
jgi:hypothetical protein